MYKKAMTKEEFDEFANATNGWSTSWSNGQSPTDEIYNSTPKTIKEKIIHFLVRRGVFANDAIKIFELYKQEDKTDNYMEGRWDDPVSDYPIQLMAVMLIGVERVALEYIKENCPKAWFRPMFEK